MLAAGDLVTREQIRKGYTDMNRIEPIWNAQAWYAMTENHLIPKSLYTPPMEFQCHDATHTFTISRMNGSTIGTCTDQYTAWSSMMSSYNQAATESKFCAGNFIASGKEDAAKCSICTKQENGQTCSIPPTE